MEENFHKCYDVSEKENGVNQTFLLNKIEYKHPPHNNQARLLQCNNDANFYIHL